MKTLMDFYVTTGRDDMVIKHDWIHCVFATKEESLISSKSKDGRNLTIQCSNMVHKRIFDYSRSFFRLISSITYQLSSPRSCAVQIVRIEMCYSIFGLKILVRCETNFKSHRKSLAFFSIVQMNNHNDTLYRPVMFLWCKFYYRN